MTKKPRKGGGWSQAQRHVWHHNMAIGHAVMIQRLANTIASLPSANEEARSRARVLAITARGLERNLRSERID